VDADDLGLDRLGDARLDIGSGSARIGRRDLDLRRYDVRELRYRNARDRNQPGDRDDERDDDREPRAIDKDRRDHGFPPAADGGGLAGPGETTSPGRARCTPSEMTSSPSLRPVVMTAVDGVDWPRRMRRASARFWPSTT